MAQIRRPRATPTSIVSSSKRVHNMGKRVLPQRQPFTLPPPPPPPKTPTLEEIAARRLLEKADTGKVCIIVHSEELVDILYCEPIAREYHNDGYKVIWPVSTQFEYNKYFPHIVFLHKNLLNIPSKKEVFKNENAVVLPLIWADEIMQSQSKKNVYVLCGMDEGAPNWQRDYSVENRLYKDILCLEGCQYNLVYKTSHIPSNGLKNVFVESMFGFTILDWQTVIENAVNFYMTHDAVISYMLPKLNRTPNIMAL